MSVFRHGIEYTSLSALVPTDEYEFFQKTVEAEGDKVSGTVRELIEEFNKLTRKEQQKRISVVKAGRR